MDPVDALMTHTILQMLRGGDWEIQRRIYCNTNQ